MLTQVTGSHYICRNVKNEKKPRVMACDGACVCLPVAREYALAFVSTGLVGAERKGWPSLKSLALE
jgi:hypothetical protein